uniref:ATP synthase subunit a n=1 Tax=Lanthanaphalara mira TaxID=2218050 RepID=A0A344A2G1_9HEMI|nr:ATP synthase F0 subunit 6 [Lanthanaphalara mira]AWU48952.1 ATP synthase F0 subunit 6 [Lanthanaphalara mira]
MMMSLFSMFDPMANFNLTMNWSIIMLMVIFMPLKFWTSNSRLLTLNYMIYNKLNMEFNSMFNKNILIKGTTLIMMSMFTFIMMSNLTSNFPYTFCYSAHISFSMSMAIPIWMSIILFQWMIFTKTMLAHLVPTGTPPMLMPLMVMIETTSNIIRPFALAVRLSANLIAGHLLMALLGNTMNVKQNYWPLIVIIQTIFLMFELLVALIQSYVFSVLMTLYSSEIS